jgi:hypothetical protein
VLDVTFFSAASWFFTVVFNVGTGNPKCEAGSTCVPIHASSLLKYVLSLTANYFNFLLFIFHPVL